ncbi:GNAT family N-acetyltransferase [Bacillus massiliigorillae]|uniref:GNAT family N-acetyltransferase n=1 Tax=Bacillus massiliigorillae TaxID=1243664 RepID=UPI000399C2E1|nr:GNAT family N-acetyltransferase [Bacillus massiliigorillae]
MELIIKPLYSLEELLDMQRLEQDVWGDDFTPIHQTITVAKNGGIILGAYDKDKLIGFLYSFPGFKNDSVFLCSHLVGIDIAYRGQGIGEQLKRKQKELALDKGFKLITWTFDPLESANANLNIRKLKGVCRTYIEDCYGKLDGKLNSGLPTDRFLVEWHLDSDHVRNEDGYNHRDAASVFIVSMNEAGLPYIKNVNEEVMKQLESFDTLSITVPTQFQAMKKADFSLAKEWRTQTREVFQTLFSQGFIVVDVERKQGAITQQYILIKQTEVNIELV